jgi:hypothetical protein
MSKKDNDTNYSWSFRVKFAADQPRVPAGSPEGGQWTSGGGGLLGSSQGPVPEQYRKDYEIRYSEGRSSVERAIADKGDDLKWVEKSARKIEKGLPG